MTREQETALSPHTTSEGEQYRLDNSECERVRDRETEKEREKRVSVSKNTKLKKAREGLTKGYT